MFLKKDQNAKISHLLCGSFRAGTGTLRRVRGEGDEGGDGRRDREEPWRHASSGLVEKIRRAEGEEEKKLNK